MEEHEHLLPHPYRLLHLAETGSTNAEAMRLALKGEPLPLWVLADRQTTGRGRLGRIWLSEEGNLHASLALRLSCGALQASHLSLVAGVAVIDAIRAAGGIRARARLKWPNDVLIEGAKAGGILVESSTGHRERELIAVVGVGLNLGSHPDVAGRPATHLAAQGVSCTPLDMLSRLAATMAGWLGTWQEGAGIADVRAGWLERAGPVGERIAVTTGSGLAEGRFAGLDAEGALLLADEQGATRRFTFGDVTLLSEGDPPPQARQ